MGNKILSRHYPYWMLLPVCLLFIVFTAIPTVEGIYGSFTNWNFTNETKTFVGWYNYISFLTDSKLSESFINTVVFAIVTTIFKTLFGLLMALYVNQCIRTKSFVQTIFFAPVVLSNVAVALIFVAILYPDSGILNRCLDFVGLHSLTQDWLNTASLALYSVSAIEVWKYSGFIMVIFLAGLQTIPYDYYEAAKIDGASSNQRFWKITLPLLMPAINITLILNIIGGLRVFDMIYVTTQGGPGTASRVVNTWIYDEYKGGRIGSSSAGIVILSAFIALITFTVYSWLRKKEVEY